MGDSGPAHEVATFSSRADDLHTGGILLVIYPRDCPATWSSSVHSVRLKSQIYNTLLEDFQKAIGTQLTMSTAFHPQTNGQSERTI